MNRRALFARLAAVAAAVALAPAVKADAATGLTFGTRGVAASNTLTVVTSEAWTRGTVEPYRAAPGVYAREPWSAQRRADVLNGKATGPRLPLTPPTFGAMQADCEARGCRLVVQSAKTYEDGTRWQMLRHDPDGTWKHVHLTYAGGIDVVYESVAAWRTSLHESGG